MRLCLAVLALLVAVQSHAASCRDVAASFAARTNAAELSGVLDSLNRSGQLPAQFVTKKQAQAAGWHPGQNLWQVLPNHSIGGDRFGNYEQRLPKGNYKEADLDFHGGKRGAKRLIFEAHGQRYITTDHYNTFTEVPPCQ